jgi:phosphoglycerate dehydrogenase-like enzyme
MTGRGRVLLLNPTCLEVVDAHREWLAGLDVKIEADPAWRTLTPAQYDALLGDTEAVIGPTPVALTPERMDLAARLRVISLASSGFDTVDIAAATERGIVVTIAPVPELGEVVADLAWGLLLAVAREIPLHDRQIRGWNLHRGMTGTPWRGTLGIVGLGNIGRATARRAGGFEMRVLATDPAPDRTFAAQHGIEIVPLDELLARSDFVSLHLRINEDTRHLIGAQQLACMRPTAFIVNTARRELIDEDALTQALLAGRIAGAGLDDPPANPDSPLLKMSNVVFTTHIGNRVRVGVDAVLQRAVQNALAVLQGRPCEFTVNPEVYGAPLRTPE